MARHVAKTGVIPNQVFIGCPRKIVRVKYERAIVSLSKKFPISFIIIGRADGQDAEDLLKIIKEKLLSSSYVVFDATGGNPNVSLEFGIPKRMTFRGPSTSVLTPLRNVLHTTRPLLRTSRANDGNSTRKSVCFATY
jgi:hypothetical protein